MYAKRKLGSFSAAVQAVCREYKIHNADINMKEDCDVDELVRALTSTMFKLRTCINCHDAIQWCSSKAHRTVIKSNKRSLQLGQSILPDGPLSES